MSITIVPCLSWVRPPGRVARRSSARTRATSSFGLNGLAM